MWGTDNCQELRVRPGAKRKKVGWHKGARAGEVSRERTVDIKCTNEGADRVECGNDGDKRSGSSNGEPQGVARRYEAKSGSERGKETKQRNQRRKERNGERRGSRRG